jgi:hypothetical protein
MLFITFNCTSIAGSPSTKEYGGAFVNCWLRDMNVEQAVIFAKPILENQGWAIQGIEESYDIKRIDYADKHSSDGLASYDEAERKGSCFMIHTYPKEKLIGGAA